MKDKADDCLAPPSISLPAGPDSSKFVKRRKPHTLPPLEKFRNLEGRGSPVPQVRRRSSIEEQLLQEDGQVTPAEGHPLIRLTKCPEDAAPAQGAGVATQQLPAISSRYAPLQPIRKGNRETNEQSGNTT